MTSASESEVSDESFVLASELKSGGGGGAGPSEAMMLLPPSAVTLLRMKSLM